MIGGCITSGKYNMTANVYSKTDLRDENTGQVKAKYVIAVNQGKIFARGLANLRGKDSGTLQDWGNKLNDYHYLRVKTTLEISEGDIIADIYDADGRLYGDEQFIVLGVTPTFDPFGSFIEYDILCNKSEIRIDLISSNKMAHDVTALQGLEELQ
jgi:hypothetical protein